MCTPPALLLSCSVFSARFCEYFILSAPLLCRVSCLRSRRGTPATTFPHLPSFPYRVSHFPRASFQLPSPPVAYLHASHVHLTCSTAPFTGSSRCTHHPTCCMPFIFYYMSQARPSTLRHSITLSAHHFQPLTNLLTFPSYFVTTPSLSLTFCPIVRSTGSGIC